MPGPVPKRTPQRRRSNKPATPVDTVVIEDEVTVPELNIDNPHPLAADFYASLRLSGQARFYEPSDWERARIFAHLLSDQLNYGKPSAMMYTALQKDMDALLVSEGERRRVRMEVERGVVDTSAERAKVSQMNRYRRAAGGG